MSQLESTSETLGTYLRSEREKRSISIEQVAASTKINIKILHSLESDNYDSLPAKPFVRGFVTNYTKYLGISSEEVLSRFDSFLDEKTLRTHKRPGDDPHIFVDTDDTADRSQMWLKVGLGTFVVLGIVAVIILKPTLKHRKGKKHVPVANEELVTVMPTPNLLPETAPSATPSASASATVAATASPSVSPSASPSVAASATPSVAMTAAPTPVASASPSATVSAKPTPVASASPSATVSAKPTPVASATPKATPSPSPSASEAPSKSIDTTAAASAGLPVTTPNAAKLPPIPRNEVKFRLVIKAVEDSWVKYQYDDRPIMGFTLRTDKVIWIKARESIRFMTRNPKGLVTSGNGIDFKPWDKGTGVMVVPKALEEKFTAQPFLMPNPNPQ